MNCVAPLGGNQVQRLLVHRAGQFVVGELSTFLLDLVGDVDPGEGVERAFGRARVLLEALLQQARDGGLRAADRAVQQDDAPLGAVALRRGLEHVHQVHQGLSRPKTASRPSCCSSRKKL